MRTGRDWHELESRANWTDLIAVVIGLVIQGCVVGCGCFEGVVPAMTRALQRPPILHGIVVDCQQTERRDVNTYQHQSRRSVGRDLSGWR